MRPSISGESPVNVQGSLEFRYGAVWLSALRPAKQKRWRLISWAEPMVTESEQSEPSAISMRRDDAVLGLGPDSRACVRWAETVRAGPRT